MLTNVPRHCTKIIAAVIAFYLRNESEQKKRARKSNCSRQFRVPVLIMIWSLYVRRIEMLVIMQLVWVMKMSRVKKMVMFIALQQMKKISLPSP